MFNQHTVTVTDANFESEVLRSTVPVLVEFGARWSMPSHLISPMLDEIATEKTGKAKVARIDVDDNPELARRFNVRSIPLLLFFKDGELKDHQVGAAHKGRLLNTLETLL